MKPSPFAFRFLLWLVLACCTLAFTGDAPMSQYTIPIAARSVSSADLDLDGDVDIIIGHNTAWQKTNKTISVLANINAGYFNISDTLKSYCGYQVNIFTCKIDNDEYPDLVTFYSDFSSGTAQRYIRVWYNENGNFNNYQDFTLNSSATFSGITFGDVNGDDLYDILVLSNNNRFYGVLLNNGNGGLTIPSYYSIPDYPPLGIASGDLNGDGKDDIAICGQFIEVYYSTSTGFQKEVLTQAGFKEGIEIKDFDLDGDNDLITSGIATRVVIYENSGDTALIELPAKIFPAYYSDMLVADLNNDTLPDLALLTLTHFGDTLSGINILYNEGNFNTSGPYFLKIANVGEGQRNFTSADLDGNGYGDFAIVRLHGLPMQNLLLLFNDGYGNFGPDPFVGLAQMPENKEVLQCFPNPFNDYTTFRYYIDKPARIELVVYSLNGQLISTLTNQMLNSGLHSVTWNPPNSMNGTFITCLKVNGKIYKTLKIISL